MAVTRVSDMTLKELGRVRSVQPASVDNVEYVVVAGGGAGTGFTPNNFGSWKSGGGGGGGYRSSVLGELTGGGGTLESMLSLPLATDLTVTVGAGGSGVSLSLIHI